MMLVVKILMQKISKISLPQNCYNKNSRNSWPHFATSALNVVQSVCVIKRAVKTFNARIPLMSSSLPFTTRCCKKRLFVYIFPVIFLSILLNVFKFLESSVEVRGEEVVVRIETLRFDYLYLLVNSWVR